MAENPSATEYCIRQATEHDIGFLTDVVLETIGPPDRPDEDDEARWREGYADWARQKLRSDVEDSTTSVIELSGESIGRLRVTRSAHCIELSGIQLLSTVRGRGIGTSVIQGLQKEAASAGLPLELEVGRYNEGAQRLYARLGFRPIGESAKDFRLRWTPAENG